MKAFNYGGGHSWRDNNITENQIMEVNSRIDKGSPELWAALTSKLSDAFENGILEK